MNYTLADFDMGGLLKPVQSTTRSHESEHNMIKRRLNLAMNVVDDIERRMGIEQRWTYDQPEYKKAEQYLKQRQFIRVVEDVEVLVVQQLFELAKANLAGTSGWLIIFLSCYTYLIVE
jgi:hypothetical protein